MYFVQNGVLREFGRRDKNFRTIAIDKILILCIIYIKEQARLSLSKRMQAGLNRAEVLTVLLALINYSIYSIKIVEAWLLLRSGLFY